jgi:hypothetical protein
VLELLLIDVALCAVLVVVAGGIMLGAGAGAIGP